MPLRTTNRPQDLCFKRPRRFSLHTNPMRRSSVALSIRGGGGTGTHDSTHATTQQHTHMHRGRSAHREMRRAHTHFFISLPTPVPAAKSPTAQSTGRKTNTKKAARGAKNWPKGYGRDCSGLDSTALDWTALLRKKSANAPPVWTRLFGTLTSTLWNALSPPAGPAPCTGLLCTVPW